MRTSVKLALALSILAASGTAAGVFAFRSNHQVETKPVVVLEADDDTEVEDDEIANRLNPLAALDTTLGNTRTFRYEAEGRVNMGSPKSAQNSSTLVRVTATLELTAVEKNGDQTVFMGQISNATAEHGSGSTLSPYLTTEDSKSLNSPFFVSMKKDGTIAKFHLPKGATDIAKGFMKGAVRSLQVVHSTDALAGAWMGEETDALGVATVIVRRPADNLISKKKSHYSQVAMGKGLRNAGEVGTIDISGSTEIEMDKLGWPNGVQIHEKMLMDYGEGVPEIRTENVANVSRKGEVTTNPERLGAYSKNKAQLEDAPVWDDIKNNSGQKEADMRLVGNATSQELVKQALSVGAERGKARGDAMTKLEAFLRLNPEKTAEVKKQILSTPDNPAVAPLVGALAGAGTKESQKALSDIISSKEASPPLRNLATNSLAFQENPTEEAIDTLNKEMRSNDPERRSAAALAAGTQARTLASLDGATKGSQVDSIMRLYKQATTIDERVELLRALGNSGDVSILSVLRDAIHDDEGVIRNAATAALRFLPAGEADTLLAERLTSDPVSEVRKTAVLSCSFRSLTPLAEALVTVMQKDTEANVRFAVVTMAAKHKISRAEANTLVEMGLSDQDEKVRHAATNATKKS